MIPQLFLLQPRNGTFVVDQPNVGPPPLMIAFQPYMGPLKPETFLSQKAPRAQLFNSSQKTLIVIRCKGSLGNIIYRSMLFEAF